MTSTDIETLHLLDWETSITLADNDPELAKDILILTCRALPGDMQEITEAFESNNEREMRRLLHKLEGGISYAKFPRLEYATLALHAAFKNGIDDNSETLFNQLESAMAETIIAIEKHINTAKI
jgi:HPt (histidine-containing phosphotransfer) domain-containing protein